MIYYVKYCQKRRSLFLEAHNVKLGDFNLIYCSPNQDTSTLLIFVFIQYVCYKTYWRSIWQPPALATK